MLFTNWPPFVSCHDHLAKVGHKRGSGTWAKVEDQRTTSSVMSQDLTNDNRMLFTDYWLLREKVDDQKLICLFVFFYFSKESRGSVEVKHCPLFALLFVFFHWFVCLFVCVFHLAKDSRGSFTRVSRLIIAFVSFAVCFVSLICLIVCLFVFLLPCQRQQR